MKELTKRQVKERKEEKPEMLTDEGISDESTHINTHIPELTEEEEKNAIEMKAFLEQDDAGSSPVITEDVYVEPEKPVTPEDTIGILQEKIKALEEAVLRGNKPYTKAAEGATVCPECGSFTDWKMNPLTYGCKKCGASFHPQKPSG